MNRTGLAARVPSPELCMEMATNPKLTALTCGTPLVWVHYRIGAMKCRGWHVRRVDEPLAQSSRNRNIVSAPGRGDMLVWLLEKSGWVLASRRNAEFERRDGSLWSDWTSGKMAPLTDPDALARACIEAAK